MSHATLFLIPVLFHTSNCLIFFFCSNQYITHISFLTRPLQGAVLRVRNLLSHKYTNAIRLQSLKLREKERERNELRKKNYFFCNGFLSVPPNLFLVFASSKTVFFPNLSNEFNNFGLFFSRDTFFLFVVRNNTDLYNSIERNFLPFENTKYFLPPILKPFSMSVSSHSRASRKPKIMLSYRFA